MTNKEKLIKQIKEGDQTLIPSQVGNFSATLWDGVNDPYDASSYKNASEIGGGGQPTEITTNDSRVKIDGSGTYDVNIDTTGIKSGGLEKVVHDATLSGDGTDAVPLSVISNGIGYAKVLNAPSYLTGKIGDTEVIYVAACQLISGVWGVGTILTNATPDGYVGIVSAYDGGQGTITWQIIAAPITHDATLSGGNVSGQSDLSVVLPNWTNDVNNPTQIAWINGTNPVYQVNLIGTTDNPVATIDATHTHATVFLKNPGNGKFNQLLTASVQVYDSSVSYMSQVLFDSITANSKFQNVPDLLYGQFEEDGKSYTIGVANASNPEFKILSIQLTYAVIDSD